MASGQAGRQAQVLTIVVDLLALGYEVRWICFGKLWSQDAEAE